MDAEASRTFLDGENIWSCLSCGAHLTYHNDIISKNFLGRHGRAFLCSNVYVRIIATIVFIPTIDTDILHASLMLSVVLRSANIVMGEPVGRRLMTGDHTIGEIRCNICDTYLGWKYVS